MATHEQKFTAKQSHAHRTRLDGAWRVVGHLDIGQQLHFLTVEGDGRCVQQAGKTPTLKLTLALLESVLCEDDGRRVHHHHTGVTVDDDPVVLAHQLAAQACADHRRNVQAARHDGGMRGLATDIGDEAGKHALLELQHIGRGEIVRQQDQGNIDRVVEQQVLLRRFALCARCGRHHRRGHTFHGAQHFLRDLLQIALALAQVFVLHFVELTRDDFQLGRQRPLGVVQAFGDPVLDPANQFVVLQQHEVHIQQCSQFMRRFFGTHVRNARLQAMNFVHHRIAPTAHAINLGINLGGINEIVSHVHPARRHQHRASDGDTPGHRQSMDSERHLFHRIIDETASVRP